MNKQGYTLVELMISMAIFVGILLIFMYVLKNTILFINLYKQETVLLNNVNIIKSKIDENFKHDIIKLLPAKELSLTGIYSIKDNVVNNQKIHSIDVVALEYQDMTSSGITQNGILVLWIVNNSWKKIIIPPATENWFFAIRYLSNTGNLLEYTLYNTGHVVTTRDDYINTHLKIQKFQYSLINDNTYLRIDISYDNDIDGEYEKIGKTDEYYFSGSTFFLKKIDINK